MLTPPAWVDNVYNKGWNGTYDGRAPSGCIAKWSSVSAAREVVQVRRTPSAKGDRTSDSPARQPQLRNPLKGPGPGGCSFARWVAHLTSHPLQLISLTPYSDGVCFVLSFLPVRRRLSTLQPMALMASVHQPDAQAPTPSFLHRLRALQYAPYR